jgi:hypothetical protein
MRRFALDVFLQIVQSGLPELTIVVEPTVDRPKWLRIELIESMPPAPLLANEVSAAQDA